MKRKTLWWVVALLLFLAPAPAPAGEGQPPKDEGKLTDAGKYVTSLQAYLMWRADPKGVRIVDCRLPEEYVFVGHAPMAHNIPSMLWTGVWNPEKKSYELSENPEFEAYAKARFAPGDRILVMCRSGHRSAASVNRLTRAGFTDVYNIVDGFEGDKVDDEESYYHGKRMKNGWKNAGVPWTYGLDPNLVYAP